MDALKKISESSMKKELPQFNVGDTVKVHVSIKEASKKDANKKDDSKKDGTRIQMFEGTVIAKKGSGISETFTVRRISYGVGVERVFPIHSPTVKAVELVRKGRVRRSKLYYLRKRIGKAAKVKQQLG